MEEQVKLLIGLLNSESPLTRTAAALSLPWYMDTQALEPLERAMHDKVVMVGQASVWAYTILKKKSP